MCPGTAYRKEKDCKMSRLPYATKRHTNVKIYFSKQEIPRTKTRTVFFISDTLKYDITSHLQKPGSLCNSGMLYLITTHLWKTYYYLYNLFAGILIIRRKSGEIKRIGDIHSASTGYSAKNTLNCLNMRNPDVINSSVCDIIV